MDGTHKGRTNDEIETLITVVLLTSSVVHANCMRETVDDTICGQGPLE